MAASERGETGFFALKKRSLLAGRWYEYGFVTTHEVNRSKGD